MEKGTVVAGTKRTDCKSDIHTGTVFKRIRMKFVHMQGNGCTRKVSLDTGMNFLASAGEQIQAENKRTGRR